MGDGEKAENLADDLDVAGVQRRSYDPGSQCDVESFR
jgi:hypothetical protein